jgi:hypothetical protein
MKYYRHKEFNYQIIRIVGELNGLKGTNSRVLFEHYDNGVWNRSSNSFGMGMDDFHDRWERLPKSESIKLHLKG